MSSMRRRGWTHTHTHTLLYAHTLMPSGLVGLGLCLMSLGQFLTLLTGSHTSPLIINLQ